MRGYALGLSARHAIASLAVSTISAIAACATALGAVTSSGQAQSNLGSPPRGDAVAQALPDRLDRVLAEMADPAADPRTAPVLRALPERIRLLDLMLVTGVGEVVYNVGQGSDFAAVPAPGSPLARSLSGRVEERGTSILAPFMSPDGGSASREAPIAVATAGSSGGRIGSFVGKLPGATPLDIGATAGTNLALPDHDGGVISSGYALPHPAIQAREALPRQVAARTEGDDARVTSSAVPDSRDLWFVASGAPLVMSAAVLDPETFLSLSVLAVLTVGASIMTAWRPTRVFIRLRSELAAGRSFGSVTAPERQDETGWAAQELAADRGARPFVEPGIQPKSPGIAEDILPGEMCRGSAKLAAGDLGMRPATGVFPARTSICQDFTSALERIGFPVRPAGRITSSIRDRHAAMEAAAGVISARHEAQACTIRRTTSAVDRLAGSPATHATSAAGIEALARTAIVRGAEGSAVKERAATATVSFEASSLEMVKIIEDIALQTGVPGLNAGIEAERSGPDGCGFAVVASEARQLAPKSRDAARQSRNLIERSSVQVDLGVAHAGSVGASLTEMDDGVLEVAKRVTAISSAVSEKAVDMAGVSGRAARLEGTRSSTAATVLQVDQAAAALRADVEELSRALAGAAVCAPVGLDRFAAVAPPGAGEASPRTGLSDQAWVTPVSRPGQVKAPGSGGPVRRCSMATATVPMARQPCREVAIAKGRESPRPAANVGRSGPAARTATTGAASVAESEWFGADLDALRSIFLSEEWWEDL